MKKVVRRSARNSRQLRSQVSHKSRRTAKAEQPPTSDVTYEIVQHDGGWAYKVNGAFSEPFPTHAEAVDAAALAAAEQELPGDAETIEYEDDKGQWHSETVSGKDRPHATVKDTNA